MANRRLLVAATTGDALADQDIRQVDVPSIVNMWASCVTITDNIGLRLDKTIMMDDGIVNIRAAALSLIDAAADQVVFNTLVGPGQLRIPVSVTTSAIIHISVEPVV
jgi:hypothetical protein